MTDYKYLQTGNVKQNRVYNLLVEHKIMEILEAYDPIVVGTIPIGIHLDKSDVDIVCKVGEFDKVHDFLTRKFSIYEGFRVKQQDGILVCNFFIGDMEFELYCSNRETYETNGYRHMLIEHRLLKLFGIDFKDQVISLKKDGYKTEPAFARLLGLEGNPYEELLKLEDWSDDEIIQLLK